MERHAALVRLSEEHHHGLVFALRIERELPDAGEPEVAALYDDLLRFWVRGLLPHFHTESECLLARLVRYVPLDGDSVQRLQRDHLSLEALVAAMRDADTIELRRSALVAFGEALRAHIRWEERDLFNTIQQRFAPLEIEAAGREILARHEKPSRPPWQDGV